MRCAEAVERSGGIGVFGRVCFGSDGKCIGVMFEGLGGVALGAKDLSKAVQSEGSRRMTRSMRSVLDGQCLFLKANSIVVLSFREGNKPKVVVRGSDVWVLWTKDFELNLKGHLVVLGRLVVVSLVIVIFDGNAISYKDIAVVLEFEEFFVPFPSMKSQNMESTDCL